MRGLTRAFIPSTLTFLILSTMISPPTYSLRDEVKVSPGEFDYPLGEGFPREDRVKLDYPKTTILTNSSGELLFNVTLTTYNYTLEADDPNGWIVKTLSIYIPPEFQINNGIASVWTSFTNDYDPSSISMTKTYANDPIAPDWTLLKIFNLNITETMEDVEHRVFLENRSQIIRLFNVSSPTIAGRYFFKAFISTGSSTYSIGSSNFPTIVVKADLNPAYVSGVVRYGDALNPSLYGRPLDNESGTLPKDLGGRVYAEGLTGDGRVVKAQAYFNATSEGRYTLYGLAPATYNLTVQAAGYPSQTFLEAVTVARGQSVENLDLYVREGVNITGVVHSKHGFDEIPWGLSYNQSIPPFNGVAKTIKIEVTDLEENVIASSPLRLYDKTFLTFKPRDTLDPSSTMFFFALKREAGWDGHIPQDYANYTSGIPSGDYYVKAHVAGYVQVNPTVVHVRNETRLQETSLDLQRTNYLNITVHFKQRRGNMNPSPTLTGGFLYYELLDATGTVAGFNISYVPPGLSTFTMQVRGIDIWNRFLLDEAKRPAWLYSHDRGLLPGTYTVNALFMNQTVDFIALNALIVSTPEMRAVFPTTTEALVTAFPPTLLELTNRETPLYFQLTQVKATIVGFCNSPTEMSFELVLGGGFNLTLYSLDWQKPPIRKAWAHPGSSLRIDIQDSTGSLIDILRSNLTQPPGEFLTVSSLGWVRSETGVGFGRAIGLKTGTYTLKVYTPGYLEYPFQSPITITVSQGDVTDARINLLRGSVVEVTLLFKTEGLFTHINNRLAYAHPLNNIDATPVRIELFDDSGELASAEQTYVKENSDSLYLTIDGFDDYWGNPRTLWTNFYDTTDAYEQLDSGLPPGEYQLRVIVAGYQQVEVIAFSLGAKEEWRPSNASLILGLERLGYLSGQVIWCDWLDQALPLSWGTLTAYSSNGFKEVYASTLDGFYEMWLLPGEYDFGIHHLGFETKYLRLGFHVSPGSCSSINFYMN